MASSVAVRSAHGKTYPVANYHGTSNTLRPIELAIAPDLSSAGDKQSDKM